MILPAPPVRSRPGGPSRQDDIPSLLLQRRLGGKFPHTDGAAVSAGGNACAVRGPGEGVDPLRVPVVGVKVDASAG